MKNIIFFLCAVFSLSASAQASLVSSFFLTLPDSIFTCHYHCFSEKDSFPAIERKRMLAAFENEVHESSDTIRFFIRFITDSTKELQFTAGENSITLKVIGMKRGQATICVMSESCDMVMCDQQFRYYRVSNKKITSFDPLPYCYPDDLFFDKAYLEANKDSLQGCIDGVELRFTGDPAVLEVSINTDFFDADLFGNSPMTHYDPTKVIRYTTRIRLKGNKYVFEKNPVDAPDVPPVKNE